VKGRGKLKKKRSRPLSFDAKEKALGRKECRRGEGERISIRRPGKGVLSSEQKVSRPYDISREMKLRGGDCLKGIITNRQKLTHIEEAPKRGKKGGGSGKK